MSRAELYAAAKDAEAMPKLSGVFADLLQSAVSSVNWHEIAASLIDEVAEILGVRS